MSPRTYPPAPGWSSDDHRIKAPLQYGRGPEKVWVYGALRVRETVGPLRSLPPHAILKVTCGCSKWLQKANPTGDLYLITDNLSNHKSPPIREWLGNNYEKR